MTPPTPNRLRLELAGGGWEMICPDCVKDELDHRIGQWTAAFWISSKDPCDVCDRED